MPMVLIPFSDFTVKNAPFVILLMLSFSYVARRDNIKRLIEIPSSAQRIAKSRCFSGGILKVRWPLNFLSPNGSGTASPSFLHPLDGFRYDIFNFPQCFLYAIAMSRLGKGTPSIWPHDIGHPLTTRSDMYIYRCYSSFFLTRSSLCFKTI